MEFWERERRGSVIKVLWRARGQGKGIQYLLTPHISLAAAPPQITKYLGLVVVMARTDALGTPPEHTICALEPRHLRLKKGYLWPSHYRLPFLHKTAVDRVGI
jgi:hypothetical protein